MKWSSFFTSSIGKKFVMGLTGLFLITFLVVHVGINSCIWANDHGLMFNKAAHFMGSSVLIRLMEIGLFAGLLLHTYQGYLLTVQNQRTRSVGYAVSMGNKGSKWYSRSMGLLGTLLLLFLILHISHFWIPSRINQDQLTPVSVPYGGEIHNLYAKMFEVFQGNLLIVVIYVLGCISLAYHLAHGFQSAFRTIGLYNTKYLSLVSTVGLGFSIIVPLAFAAMPIGIYLGWIEI